MQNISVQANTKTTIEHHHPQNWRSLPKSSEAIATQSEQMFRQFVEQVPVAVAMVDRKMRYLAMSQRWRNTYCFGDCEAIGASHYDLFPHLSEKWKEIYHCCLSAGEAKSDEDCFIKPDGTVEWVKWEIQPWTDNFGKIGGLILYSEPIGDRKQLADALQLTQFAMDKAADAVFWMTADAKLSYVNEAACQLLDYSTEELNSLTVSDIDPTFNRAIWAEHWLAIKQFKKFTFESNYRTKNGEIIPVEVRVNYLKFNGEEYHCAFVRDITERKQAQLALQNANEQLQAVLDAVPGLVSWVSSDLRYVGVNHHLSTAFKMPLESFPGQRVGFLENSPKFAQLVEEFFASEEKTISQEVTIAIEGKPCSYLIVAQKYNQGKNAVFVGLDISDRKQMEAALRRSETLYRTLAKNFPNGAVCLFDADLRYTLAEGTELSKVGLSKEYLESRNLREVFGEEIATLCEPFYRAALAGKETVTEVPYADRLYLAHHIPVRNDNGEILAGMVMTQNITERKQAEVALRDSEERFRQQAQQLERTLDKLKKTQSQLIQTEKMSSLGQLVAGVAHEINNPVSFIYGNIAHAQQYANELLDLVALYGKHYPDPEPEIEAYLDDIGLEFLREDFPKLMTSMQVGADRIREVVLSLRNFSRLDQAQKKPVNIHEGIDSTLLILQNRLKAKAGRHSIEIIKEYGELPLIECYAGQLNQVFMNLLTNAIDAVEEKEKKAEKYAAFAPPSSPCIHIRTAVTKGKCITLEITDNGVGMTAETKKRLFDPFFTTKPAGQGTGLGLSISYQIVVEKHGGKIRCDSTPGVGTLVKITLPIA
ncbi:PAS domain-containing sensor histidine kinase [Phormidium sp. CCY1219]|uniref:PAS domain-containing sensor histidine kinase n=1 Tax=Phormidium sp. CCY1219 TaxID=2886104 RepID=UPI002D1F8DF0|nr:PAS domain S-box protein [Phormidium sp. CCY1219]MEB3831269.1 PAS domain S-box protein [Phormidium sp. CCY1219]